MSILYILISCEMDFEESVFDDLLKFDSIKEVIQVVGSYDIVVKLDDATSKTTKTLLNEIRSMKKIKNTLTLPTLEK